MTSLPNPAPESGARIGNGLKLALEAGPLLLFFAAYSAGGIFWATGAAIVASVLSVVVYWSKLGTVPFAPLVTFVVVGVFGGLTLAFHNPDFVKMKPSIVYLIFAGSLLGGLAFGRIFLRKAFHDVFHLTDEGWRALTIRWAIFFLAMAVANELIWRNFEEHVWVNFKVWGALPLTLLFAMAQYPILKRHALPDPKNSSPS